MILSGDFHWDSDPCYWLAFHILVRRVSIFFEQIPFIYMVLYFLYELLLFHISVLRSLRKVHYTITTIAFSTWGTLENSILAIVFGVLSLPDDSRDWLLASSLILLTFVGQLSIIFATKCELASIGSLVNHLIPYSH